MQQGSSGACKQQQRSRELEPRCVDVHVVALRAAFLAVPRVRRPCSALHLARRVALEAETKPTADLHDAVVVSAVDINTLDTDNLHILGVADAPLHVVRSGRLVRAARVKALQLPAIVVAAHEFGVRERHEDRHEATCSAAMPFTVLRKAQRLVMSSDVNAAAQTSVLGHFEPIALNFLSSLPGGAVEEFEPSRCRLPHFWPGIFVGLESVGNSRGGRAVGVRVVQAKVLEDVRDGQAHNNYVSCAVGARGACCGLRLAGNVRRLSLELA